MPHNLSNLVSYAIDIYKDIGILTIVSIISIVDCFMLNFRKTQEFCQKQHNLAILKVLIDKQSGVGFNAILKEISPATPRILSQRLKELEKIGLVQKNLVLGTKPKIEYLALPKAQALKKALSDLEKWGNLNLDTQK